MEWFVHNLGALAAIVVPSVVVIGALYLYGARITALETGHKELKDEVHLHQSDKAIHIDPNRDKQIWDTFQREIMRRLDQIDERLDKALLNIRP